MTDKDYLFSPPRNFACLDTIYSDEEKAKTVILPVPYDATMEWHTGSRFGPSAIIEASELLEFYDIELDCEPYKKGIYTTPFLLPDISSPEKTLDKVYRAAKPWTKKHKFLITLGGEHTVTLGPVKAFKEEYKDICVIQLDAHADLRDEYNGSRYGQATVMRRIYEICPIFQIGIRSISIEEKRFIHENNIPVIFSHELINNPNSVTGMIERTSENVYLTIDLDVLDPSIMPAVGTPEPGGIQWHQILEIIKLISSRRNVVGADIVELCPPQGNSSCSYTAAKLAYKLIGYCIRS